MTPEEIEQLQTKAQEAETLKQQLQEKEDAYNKELEELETYRAKALEEQEDSWADQYMRNRGINIVKEETLPLIDQRVSEIMREKEHKNELERMKKEYWLSDDKVEIITTMARDKWLSPMEVAIKYNQISEEQANVELLWSGMKKDKSIDEMSDEEFAEHWAQKKAQSGWFSKARI